METQVIKVLKEFKDYFAWDYDEMPGVSRDLVELKLPIRPNKRPVELTPKRFALEVMSKIKAEVEIFLKKI